MKAMGLALLQILCFLTLASCGHTGRNAPASNQEMPDTKVEASAQDTTADASDQTQENSGADENMSEAEREVLAAYQMRCDAMTEKDVVLLDTLMADDLILRHISGATQTKQEWLACIENDEMHYYGIDVQDVQVEVTGDTAIVQHTAAIDAKIYGSRGTWTLSGVSHYRKIDNVWVWGNAPE